LSTERLHATILSFTAASEDCISQPAMTKAQVTLQSRSICSFSVGSEK